MDICLCTIHGWFSQRSQVIPGVTYEAEAGRGSEIESVVKRLVR